MGGNTMSIIKKIKVFWHDSEETNLHAVKGSKGRFDLYFSQFFTEMGLTD